MHIHYGAKISFAPYFFWWVLCRFCLGLHAQIGTAARAQCAFGDGTSAAHAGYCPSTAASRFLGIWLKTRFGRLYVQDGMFWFLPRI